MNSSFLSTPFSNYEHGNICGRRIVKLSSQIARFYAVTRKISCMLAYIARSGDSNSSAALSFNEIGAHKMHMYDETCQKWASLVTFLSSML